MRVLLLNPKAGQVWRRWRHASAITRHRQGLEVVETEPGRIVEQTRALVREGVEAVYAGGGDGTVADVAAGLSGSDVPLGIVPLGTTNVLAREFQIPLDAAKALDALSVLTTRRILRTWISDRGVLVLGAGAGWDGRLMHRVSSNNKRWLGAGGMWFTAFRLLVQYDFPRLHVEGLDANGEPVSVTGTSVIVSNIRYWSSANPAIVGADPADDLLAVVVLHESSVTHLAAFWLRMMSPNGRPLSQRGVSRLQLSSLQITQQHGRPVEVHLNGEPSGCVPISFRPGPVVQVLAPLV